MVLFLAKGRECFNREEKPRPFNGGGTGERGGISVEESLSDPSSSLSFDDELRMLERDSVGLMDEQGVALPDDVDDWVVEVGLEVDEGPHPPARLAS